MQKGEHGTEGKEQIPVLYKDPYGAARGVGIMKHETEEKRKRPSYI